MWPDPTEIQELLRQAGTGDRPAVDALFDRHRGALRRAVELRMDPVLARRLDASDVVQAALIDASRRLAEYLREPKMPFHLWLRQLAQDRLIDAHRRHRVAARRSLDREQPLTAPAALDHSTIELAAQLCDAELTPAAAALRAELAVRLREAIDSLDAGDREVVLLRHFEQLSNQDVAQALGLSEAAASMRYLRAIRRLRARLVPDSSQEAGP